MAFHNVSLPSDVQYQSVAGAGFSTIIQESASGHEYRVARQAQGRHRFTLRKELQSEAEAKAVKAFALGRRGSLHSFRLKDWSDYTTADDGITAPATTDQVIGIGDGTETTFQLIKLYDESGDAPYPRVLTLPVDGTVVAAINGTPTTSFTISGDGQIVFGTAPVLDAVITAGCEFDVPVRFTKAFDEWASMQADAWQTWSFPDMGCIEVLSEVEMPERWASGGGREWGATAQNVLLSFNDGKLHSIAASAAMSAFLPPIARIPSGRIFTVHVPTGSAGSVQVRDDSGTAVGSAIAAGETKFVDLVRGTSTSTWVLY